MTTVFAHFNFYSFFWSFTTCIRRFFTRDLVIVFLCCVVWTHSELLILMLWAQPSTVASFYMMFMSQYISQYIVFPLSYLRSSCVNNYSSDWRNYSYYSFLFYFLLFFPARHDAAISSWCCDSTDADALCRKSRVPVASDVTTSCATGWWRHWRRGYWQHGGKEWRFESKFAEVATKNRRTDQLHIWWVQLCKCGP